MSSEFPTLVRDVRTHPIRHRAHIARDGAGDVLCAVPRENPRVEPRKPARRGTSSSLWTQDITATPRARDARDSHGWR